MVAVVLLLVGLGGGIASQRHRRRPRPERRRGQTLSLGPIDNVVVEDNDLRGGTYSLYVRAEGGLAVSNVRVVGNRWHSGADYGTHSVDPLSAVTDWSANTLDGTPVAL